MVVRSQISVRPCTRCNRLGKVCEESVRKEPAKRRASSTPIQQPSPEVKIQIIQPFQPSPSNHFDSFLDQYEFSPSSDSAGSVESPEEENAFSTDYHLEAVIQTFVDRWAIFRNCRILRFCIE